MKNTFQLSLAIVIGAFSSLYHPAAFLFLAFLFDRHFAKIVLIALVSAFMVWCRTEMPTEGFNGAGAFNIASISQSGDNWLYRGYWYPHGKAIPATVIVPDDGATIRPPATCDWWIQGELECTDSGRYRIKIDPYEPWYAVPHTFNLGEWRIKAKEFVGKWIEKHIRNPSSAAFLTGIATGTFDDFEMISQFSRFGLQHIMAISGFHFSLIAGFLGWCFRPLLGHRNSCLALILLLTAYCIFLGSAPSVLRAWMSLSLGLWGLYCNRVTSGLNALGLAISILIAWDPLLLTTIGFCFSCLTTAGILLFYRPAEKLISRVLPIRTLLQSAQLSTIDQYGFCLGTLLRSMLALTLAVNIVAIPTTLFYFGYFPLMSLVYNLFFPLFVAISMVLLILSIPLPFLHSVNEFWTSHMLVFTSNMPSSVDVGVSFEMISAWILAGILGVLYLTHRFLFPTKWRFV